jgi:hypothetical protein
VSIVIRCAAVRAVASEAIGAAMRLSRDLMCRKVLLARGEMN